MRPDIKDKNLFYLAIPGIVEGVVTLFLQDHDTDPVSAIRAFYASPAYAKLEDPESGLWRKSVKEIYSDFLSSGTL